MNDKGWLTSVHGIEGVLLRGTDGELLLEKGHPRARELAEKARNTAARTRIVTRAELRKETGDERARIAAFRSGPGTRDQGWGTSESANNRPTAHGTSGMWVKLEDLRAEANEAKGVVIALDQVQDSHNVGAILRSCNWFGVTAVVIPTRRSAAINDAVIHVSAGAALHVRMCSVVNLARSLRALASAGYWIYGTDAGGESCNRAVLNEPAVVVVGSEGQGLRPNVRDACDAMLSIPGYGVVDSLNVSVATGIILYEFQVRRT